MPIYLISDVTVRNPEAFEAYRTRAAPSIAKFGGAKLSSRPKVRVRAGENFIGTAHVKALAARVDKKADRSLRHDAMLG